MSEPGTNHPPVERYDDPKWSTTALAGTVGAIITIAVIVALQGLYFGMERGELSGKLYGQKPEAFLSGKSQQIARLNSYGWTDKDKGVVHIPLERARQLFLSETRADGPRPPRSVLAQ